MMPSEEDYKMINMRAGYRSFATKIVSTDTAPDFFNIRRVRSLEGVLLLLLGVVVFFLIIRA